MTRQQKLTFGFFAGLLVFGYFLFQSPESHEELSSIAKPRSETAAQPQAVSKPAKTETPKMMQRAAASQPEADDPETAQPTTMTPRERYQGVRHSSPIHRDVSVGELSDSNIVQGSWKLVTSVFAVPRSQVSEEDRSQMIGELSGFAIFEAGRAGVAEEPFSSERGLVVYDTRMQQFGVLTGTVMVQLRVGASLDALVQQHQLRVLEAFPETRTYFVTSSEQPFSLNGLKNALGQDSRVNKIEIEIVSHRYGKQ